MQLWQTNPLQDITLVRGEGFRLFPPYIISVEEMDRFLAAFERASQGVVSIQA